MITKRDPNRRAPAFIVVFFPGVYTNMNRGTVSWLRGSGAWLRGSGAWLRGSGAWQRESGAWLRGSGGTREWWCAGIAMWGGVAVRGSWVLRR